MDSRAARIADLLTQLIDLLTEHQQPDVPEIRTVPERVLFTVEEAAEQLHIGRTRMFALLKTGEIESVAIGRLRRIHIDAINNYARCLFTQQAA